VTLIDQDGDLLETVLTDSGGRFRLRVREAGVHRLEADRLGYGVQRTDTFFVSGNGTLTQEVSLVPRAIELDSLAVRVSPGAILHEATLSGVFARRARSPSAGSNRVLVRGDPDLDSAWRVRDVLPSWMPRPFCERLNERGDPIPYLYFDGWEARGMGPEGTDWVLDLPIREVEAVEYYRDLTSTPMALRPDDRGNTIRGHPKIRACGVVAVWSRGAPR
jgi:hypothetical protein